MSTCARARPSRRPRVRRLPRVLGCVCLAGAIAFSTLPAASAYAASASGGGSGGGGSAFSELTEGGQSSTETTATATTGSATSTSKSGSSGTVLLVSLIAAGVLLAGIAYVILRDAHRVAPVPDGQIVGGGRSGRDPAAMMRKRRAKAKAARAQRKRNR